MKDDRVHLSVADARALSERAMCGIGYEPEEAALPSSEATRPNTLLRVAARQ
jgi:hypothetical protein